MVFFATAPLPSPVANIPKVQAMRVAERDMATLGFQKPKAYGCWMQNGFLRVSLKNPRGDTLFAWVSPKTGRLVYAHNKSRYPKDIGKVEAAGSPPNRAANLALMQKIVGANLRLARWDESWSNRIETWYEIMIGPRLLMGDRGAIRAHLLQDPLSGEPISFGSIEMVPRPPSQPDRIKPADAERMGRKAFEGWAGGQSWTGVKIDPIFPARPGLFLTATKTAVPVWRIRINFTVPTNRRVGHKSVEVLVNSINGRVEGIVPRQR